MNETREEMINRFDMAAEFRRFLAIVDASMSHPDIGIFEANVRLLMAKLPWDIAEEVESCSEEYNNKVTTPIFQRFCNTNIGTVAEPLCYKRGETGAGSNMRVPVKRLEDGSVDWSDPLIYSPRMVTETVTDYEKLYRVIMREAENIDVTWRPKRVRRAEK